MKSIIEFISNILTNTEFITLTLFFSITVINQLVGTLKSIFVANKAGFLAYITVAIDALLYTLLVKALTTQTYMTVILFVIGRVLGTYLANIIESKIAVGIYDIDLYIKDHDKQKELQDKLIEEGFSSTMNIGTISDNKVRWSNNVQLKRKDMNKFYNILDELNISNPTMIIRQAKKVTGKIEEHI